MPDPNRLQHKFRERFSNGAVTGPAHEQNKTKQKDHISNSHTGPESHFLFDHVNYVYCFQNIIQTLEMDKSIEFDDPDVVDTNNIDGIEDTSTPTNDVLHEVNSK